MLHPAHTSTVLAPEIWLTVFNALRDREDIVNIVWTCRTFRGLAQPLLFQHLSVRPFAWDSFFGAHPEIEQDYVVKQIKRLSFFASDRIGHAVRTCDVKHYDRQMIGNYHRDDSPILMALFRLLHRFVNLSQLNCTSLRFTDNEWTQLCGVQRLHVLQLEGCFVGTDIPLHAHIDVDRLVIKNKKVHGIFPGHNISMFNLDSIRTLSLSTMSRDDSTTFLHCIHKMQSLRCLDISLSHASLAWLLTALPNLPVLESLSVRSMSWDDGEFHKTLPHIQLQPFILKNYSGPIEILPLIMHGQRLRSMHLESLCADNRSDPAILLQVLSDLQEHFVDMESVTVSVNYLTDNNCSDLCLLFPATLKVFSICVKPSDALEDVGAERQRMIFKNMLHTLPGRSIPAGITKLLVRWCLEEKGQSTSDAEYIWLKNALTERFPALECIWFSSFQDNFFWKCGAGGVQYFSHEHDPIHQSMFQDDE